MTTLKETEDEDDAGITIKVMKNLRLIFEYSVLVNQPVLNLLTHSQFNILHQIVQVGVEIVV